jgi:hypothetical protein
MKPTLNDKLIAYLALFSGLALSLVAEYYSIAGLTAIFSAAVIPTIIMGIALGLGKIVGTIWVKQNWDESPWPIKLYLCSAIVLLMLITSMGIFGFLSKAHSDQSLVSGDVMARISVYDEKIKTSKDNIDANRKALKQMDEAVDQVMARSSSETGADKAVGIRRSQQKERARLQSEIQTEQKTIATLSEERAPIAAEVRKVEAEVGPIKYIAQFVYGSTDDAILERAVTWVILLIIFVFDPLALILLISSQISFQKMKDAEGNSPQGPVNIVDGQTTVTELVEGDSPGGTTVVVDTEPPTVTDLNEPAYPADDGPLTSDQIEQIKEIAKSELPTGTVIERTVFEHKDSEPAYVQNEEQRDSNLWSNTVNSISQEDYQKASLAKLENHIDEIVDLIKSGYLKFEDVPKYIQREVKDKL